MASTSRRTTLSVSSSSSTQNPTKYEVFLSFRGEDTRHGFTSHLYDALKKLWIVVFRDKEKLEKGEKIHPYLKEAIEGSQYAVVIISERFAESKSCLFELSAIMECKRKGRITVFPVFYHVEPNNVRNQRGKFGEYFARLKEDPKVDAAEWEIWKASLVQVSDWRVDSSKVNKDPLESCGVVLKDVGDISGWHVQNRDESQIVKEIKEKIFAGLIYNSINIDKSLVGIDSQAKEIMELLHLDSGNIHYIGICGMGGIGKTTLAKVIYENASPKFEANCFIHGIGDKECLVEFKRQLICAILSKDVANSLVTEYHIDKVLNSRLINKKVLIVLDDVWRRKQIDALAKATWFGEGSRVIITSRSHDWPCLNKDNIYKVNILNNNASLQLFCSKAFPKCHPKEKFRGLIKEIVNLAKGLPLALEIFGSYLSNKEENDWQCYLNRLNMYLDPEVKDSLKITFEGLEGYIKDAFLDIVCFFNDDWHGLQKDYLHERLEWLCYPSTILTDLESKSLIKFAKTENMFRKGEFFVHDLLLQLGQELATQEGRLWRPNDFSPILQGNIGKIEIDKLKILQITYRSFEGRHELEVFSKMKNLRILDIRCFPELRWYGRYSKFKLGNELRYVRLPFYPFESFPAGWNPTKLTEIILENSKYFKQLGNENFPKLKRISLRGMTAMEETPDLSRAPCLETLDIAFCGNVSLVHPSTGLLKHLKTLSFRSCKNLERFPDRLITMSLETFDLDGCPKLKKFPDEISSKSLKVLTLGDCLELESLPSSISTKCLKVVSLYNCPKLKIIESSMEKFHFSLRRLPNLEELCLKDIRVGKLVFDIEFSKKMKSLSVWFKEIGLIRSMQHQILYNFILSNEAEFGDFNGYDGNKEFLEALLSSLKSFLIVRLINCGLESISIPKSIGHWPISKLDLSRNRFLELPNNMYKLFKLKMLILNDCTSLQALPKLPLSLHSLELRNCSSLEEFNSLMHWVIPSCWFSIKHLNLSNNRFTKLPNNICELSSLENLDLSDCTFLQTLPKLPLSLGSLSLTNCPLLKAVNSLITTKISREMLWTRVLSSTVAHVGFDCKPHKILYWDPSRDFLNRSVIPMIVCGPMAEARVPEAEVSKSSIHSSTNSYKTIQIPIPVVDEHGEGTMAMLIFYEVHKCNIRRRRRKRKRNSDELENSNIGADEGNSRILLEFACKLQFSDEEEPFVFYVPKVTQFGSHGVWVFIKFPKNPPDTFLLRIGTKRWPCSVSVTATSENVELKDCGVHLPKKNAGSKFSEIFNHSKRLAASLDNFLEVTGPSEVCLPPPAGGPPIAHWVGYRRLRNNFGMFF